MKEIFTEEEYNEAVKKYNEQFRLSLYENTDLYPTYDGYIDLRNLKLQDEDFKMLWQYQDLLYSFEQSKTCSSGIRNLYNEMKKVYLNYIG